MAIASGTQAVRATPEFGPAARSRPPPQIGATCVTPIDTGPQRHRASKTGHRGAPRAETLRSRLGVPGAPGPATTLAPTIAQHGPSGAIYDPSGAIDDPSDAICGPSGAIYGPSGAIYGPSGVRRVSLSPEGP